MRHEVVPFTFGAGAVLDSAGGPQVSNSVKSERFRERTVQIVDPGGPAWNGSLDIEGSLDGNSWAKVFSGIVGPGLFVITAAVTFLRLDVTAQAAGVVKGFFGGFDSRTDGG